MKKSLKSDKKTRKLIFRFEKKRLILKSICKNRNLLNIIRWNALQFLTDFPRKSAKSVSVNRCIVTGRRSKINKCFKFSRLIFLKFVREGEISGFKKSVW